MDVAVAVTLAMSVAVLMAVAVRMAVALAVAVDVGFIGFCATFSTLLSSSVVSRIKFSFVVFKRV